MAILDDVKGALNVVGNYADDVLNIHIDTVKTYLTNAGISQTVVDSDKSKGAIIRGVADLWSVGAGDVKFSPAFTDIVIQLAVHDPETNDEGGSE